ncbi:unnamed protein product [Trichobilharzia regenti]|nr:unnamed protein product [Trichobilharzia regenti]
MIDKIVDAIPQLTDDLHKGQMGRIAIVGGSKEDTNLTEATKCMDKVHAVTFGPGLGLTENIENTIKLIDYCKSANKPIVIDADALYIINQNPSLIQGYNKTILTPNTIEFSRLYYSVFASRPNSINDATKYLANKLGVTIVHKGSTDVISDGQAT